MKKFLLSVLCSIFFAGLLKAEFGVWASAIYLNVNGTSQFYNTQQLSPGNANAIGSVNFGANLGNFGYNSGLLKIGGAEIKTFRDNNGNVCGGTLYYTTYLQGNRPASPVFTPITLNYYCDCSGNAFSSCGGGPCTDGKDQKWQNVLDATDLTTMAAGNYTLEVYYRISGNPTTNTCDQFRYDNNSNNATNYTANFTILSVAAINFSSISASLYNNNIKVRWSVQNDIDVAKYELQKSDNGIVFFPLSIVPAQKTTGTNLYFNIDNQPNIGSNYYRVKMINDNGTASLSKTVRVYFGTVNNSIFIYPNPSGSELTIRLAGVAKGNYRLSAFTNNGERIAAIAVPHDGTDRTIKLKLPHSLSKGVYRLLLIDKVEFYKQSFLIK